MGDIEGRKDYPLVSICIPTYNSENTVKETLESVLGQTYRNIEVLVIDNKSTDRTVEVVRGFSDVRLRVIVNEENIGAEGNFNKCIMSSTGEFTGIFHSDDVYNERIIEKQVELILRFSDVDAVFTNGNNIDENGNLVSQGFIPEKVKNRALSFGELFGFVLEYGNFLFTPSALINTRIYRDNYPFRYSQFGTSSDLDMWLRVSRSTCIYILDECLIDYRISKNQGSYNYNKGRTSLANFFSVVDFHLKNVDTSVYREEVIDKYILRRKRDMMKCNVNRILAESNSEEYDVHVSLRDLKYGRDGDVLFLVFSSVVYKLFKNTVLSGWIAGLINRIDNVLN